MYKSMYICEKEVNCSLRRHLSAYVDLLRIRRVVCMQARATCIVAAAHL